MGLLDDLYNDPNSMGLLSAGMGMMSAGGPSRMPVSLGQAMNDGLRSGMGAYQQAQHSDMEKQRFNSHQQITDMQINAAKKAIADEQEAKANLARYLGEMPDGEQKRQIVAAKQMGVPLDKVWEHLNPKQESYTLSPGSTRYSPSGAPIVTAPQERKAPEGMQYGDDGSLNAIPGYVEMKSKIAAAGRPTAPPAPYFSPVQTAQGVMAFNARTGRMEPVQVGGQNVVGAQADPSLQGKIAESKEAGKTTGEKTTEAKFNLPSAIAKGESALKLVNELRSHPGLHQAVGASAMMGIQKIPGTDAYDFINRLDQVKGGAFLTAFETLKGGGQITEIEGVKATSAIARMDNATSEKEFMNALSDYESVIRTATNNAKLKAGTHTQTAQAKAIVGTGTYGGKKVVKYSDGSVDYAN